MRHFAALWRGIGLAKGPSTTTVQTLRCLAAPAASPRLPCAPTELSLRLGSLLPELRRRALRLCHNPQVADDLVQDTVERALRFFHQYEPDTNLHAWLSRILFSVFVSRCRRQKRERRALETLGNDPSTWAVPAPSVTQSGLSASAERALEAIPAQFREAVELVDLSDLSYRDAATRLGVPLGTVMSRLHRGRKLLAERLAEVGHGVREAA